MSPFLDLTRARIEIRKLERMEAHAWPQLTVAVRTIFDSLPGVKRRPRRLQPKAFNEIVDGFLARTAGNPLLLGRDTQPLTRGTSGYLAVRRLARASILVEGRSAESSYVVLELTMKASRRRWRVDQRVVPIVLSRHAMQRYLMRCGQDLGHFQASLDAALLSIKAWLRAAAENPELLPVSLAIPIESGAVLGLPYTFRAHMPWCYRLECSHGDLRKFEHTKEAMLGVVIRTFIHENMYSTLQEQRLATVQHIGCELLSALREHESFEDEALASPAPRITQLVNAMFATTTDPAWQSAFSCPASKTPHALLTYDQ